LRYWMAALTALFVVSLAGCTTPAELKAEAVQTAKEKCEKQGKKFILRDTDFTGNPFIGSEKASATGDCIGPGESGYSEK
jgi:hypothetical protein